MNENERIVCEFLRKIAPSREWRYLGEVEHYWIGELCDELNKQLKAENAKLREFIELKEMCWKYVGFCDACPYNGVDEEHYDFNCTVQEEVDSLASELGIEVGV